MSITYDGVDLLLEDDEGSAGQFIERYLATEDLRIWSPSQIYNSGQSSRMSNLATPNYPDPPRFKLNSLYWPTGATRWGYIHCLASDSMRDKLIENQENDNTAKDLVLSDGIGENLTVKMYMLPPRPITCVELEQSQGNNTPPQTTENLWLVTLVDQRYYWQFRTTKDIELEDADGWDELTEKIEETLDITILKNPIHSEWLKPDHCLLGLQQQNIAIVLEAMANSVGCRLVCDFNEDVTFLSWDAAGANDPLESYDSRKRLRENLDQTWHQIAGDEFHGSDYHEAAAVPESVIVAFKSGECSKWETFKNDATDFEGFDDGSGELHSFFSWTDNLRVTIFDTASYSDAQDSAFEDLAKRISDAYYSSLLNRYDRTFVGLMNWKPCGWDDAIEWSIGRRQPDGHREAQTRVRSISYNFHAAELFHQSGEGSDCCDSKIRPGITLGQSQITITMTQVGSDTQNCKQTITLSNATGGDWKLKYDSEKSAAIDFDVDSTALTTAMEAIEGIDAGDVTITGGPLDTDPIVIEFTGSLENKAIPLMKALFGGLTGGGEIVKDDFGYVAVLTGSVGEEANSYETARVFNRFRTCGDGLKCLFANTGRGKELIQVECE